MAERTGVLPFLVALALMWGCTSGAPPPVVERPKPAGDRVQRGGLLFLDARVSGDGTRSCATCHPGGGSDGLTYRDGERAAPGSAGARKSPRLWGLWQSPPYLWHGSLDEVSEVVDRMLAVEMRGANVEPTDRDAIAAYLLSLYPFNRGRIEPSGDVGEPSTHRQRRGSEIFRERCSSCHPAPAYTDRRQLDVGTDGTWDVPGLRGVSAEGSAPFGHDGRFANLRDASRAMPHDDDPLSDIELDFLVEYLKLL